ncbi:hypothetical protein A2780_00025 [Candidatus Daviesbacteria bacterium RIFCSPHIGHO2_01_FULL_41_45]|nr:MAG: hypothetical protein A2780_00025 [Candidatus Daviesbacteria bacterium RIFCSPHIGHO2_01_FULL_41_45]OGN22857.1 MAG: hypothetical protein A2915_01055 [Candidatus Yanofskybacteria bacterium RIFCSPLOWO2_01_FULL_41_34]
MVLMLKKPINLSEKHKSNLDLLFSICTTGLVVGGFLRSIINNEDIRDIDFCVPEAKYIDTLNKCVQSLSCEILGITDKNVKLYSNKIGMEIDILKQSKDGKFIIDDFDFTICKGYIDKNYFFTMTEADYNDLIHKKLVYCGSAWPMASYKRSLEFFEKGYSIDAYNLLKILDDCEKIEGVKIIPNSKLLLPKN